VKKVGIGIDYSNICKDYNTVYLDRDNDDRETVSCMNKIIQWISPLLEDIEAEFNFKIYRTTNPNALSKEEIACKRFLFYSLEKEMLLQSFILSEHHKYYNILSEWGEDTTPSILIKNDDEGEGIYFYVIENSDIHLWLLEKFKDFSLDEIPWT